MAVLIISILSYISDITDIRDVASPLSKVDVGLCADGNKKIPLKSVHIRARLVDLAAEVCCIH